MAKIKLRVNGKEREVDADPQMPLLWVLRERLDLTGSKYGCGVGICGACTVHVNGKAARSCTTTISDVAGKSVVTIEGLSANGDHPVQKAWIKEDVPQCGFCQAGQIMEAAALLKAHPKASDEDIDRMMKDHVCRCGTYNRIRAAIKRAAGVGQ